MLSLIGSGKSNSVKIKTVKRRLRKVFFCQGGGSGGGGGGGGRDDHKFYHNQENKEKMKVNRGQFFQGGGRG